MYSSQLKKETEKIGLLRILSNADVGGGEGETTIVCVCLISTILNNLREKILAWTRDRTLLGQVDRLGGLVVIAPARRAGDPGSIPGPGENFFS